MTLASIPSPAQGVWHLGPVPVRAYALCIIAGVVLAVWLGEKRWVARGGRPGDVTEVATWMVPMGILGGRIYHVLTTPAPYFGAGGDPIKALYIWQGGLGIWGAIVLGGVGAWIGCRRRGIPLPPFGDSLAPGIALAQAVGRFGNYFNQELYGRPTDLPWGLEIDSAHRSDGLEGRLTFHPTFLYESLWNVGVAGLVVWADRRWRLGHGRAFALYLAAYATGRFWIEALRVDPATHLLGLRLNEWTSLVVLFGAVLYILVSARRHPGREVITRGQELDGADGADGADGSEGADGADGSEGVGAEGLGAVDRKADGEEPDDKVDGAPDDKVGEEPDDKVDGEEVRT